MKNQLIFLLLILITSCNSVKRVISDPVKLDKVGKVWERQNPCVIDSIVTHYTSDTVQIIDSTMYFAYLKALDNLQPIILDPNCTKYQNLIDSLRKHTPVVKERQIIRDTIEIRSRDKRHEALLQDSLNAYIKLANSLESDNKVLKAENKALGSELKTAKFRLWLWIGILSIIAVGSHVIRNNFKLFG